MYVRAYARAYECWQIAIGTHDHDQHTPPDTAPTEHKTTGKRATTKIKFAYIMGVIAKNDKKNEKKLKKICRNRNLLYLCTVIKKRTSSTTIKFQYYGSNFGNKNLFGFFWSCSACRLHSCRNFGGTRLQG